MGKTRRRQYPEESSSDFGRYDAAKVVSKIALQVRTESRQWGREVAVYSRPKRGDAD